MTLVTSPPGTVLEAAAASVERAAHRSGVTIQELATAAETERAAELLREVWRGREHPVPANLLRTVQHTGGYAYGAYDETGALVAASLGLLATGRLHSHITGVLPSGQRRGLGFALKQHQRWWALERGFSTITWTCDPLVRRNVAFNLHALGATVVGYLPDHYGAMADGVNRGDETDRFELHWDLGSARAAAATDGRLPWVDAAGVPHAVVSDDSSLPVLLPVQGAARQVQLPADIEGLRQADAAAGAAWRRAVRDAVVPALEGGAAISGLTADGALVLEVPQ